MPLTPDISLDEEALAAVQGGRLGVAVSGGGDSVALLHLLIERGGLALKVATVDHGLRAESADEAASVAASMASLGLEHETLTWRERPGGGNLSDNARRARRALIADWARRHDLAAVALGHTADDQAETFLMRLARGSGVQGLGAMETVVEADGIAWVRPLLHVRRGDLRRWLQARGIGWIDDPTNEDARFDRVKMRRAVETLSDAGISVPGIAQTTKRLRSARQVLFTATRDLADAIARVTGAGEITLERDRLMSAQQAVRLRLVSEAVRVIAGAYYAPRAHAVEGALAEIAGGAGGASLGGCLLRPLGGDHIVVRREPGRAGDRVAFGQLWDDRWMITGPGAGRAIGALGAEGLGACPDWRDSGYAREALLSTPAVWDGDRLISAPLAGKSDGFAAEWRIRNAFFTQRADDH